MEVELRNFLLCVTIAWVSFHFILMATKRRKFSRKRLPPGPFPLPIVGNILSLRGEPLKALTDLAKTYGPVISLRVGSQTTVVVTSASMAREVLQTKDASFAYRCVPDCLTVHDYHKFSMGLRPPDESWKLCRTFFNSHVFAKSRLDATQALRKEKVEDLLSYVESCSKTGEPVDIGQVAFTTSLKFISNTLFSIDLGDPSSVIAREFKLNFTNLVMTIIAPNMADFFPILKYIDPQRIKKRPSTIIGNILMLIDRLISERMEIRESTNLKFNDILDDLLSLQMKEFQPEELRHLLFDLIIAGTETSGNLLEWTMAELMQNPDKMKKAQTELNEVIGVGTFADKMETIRRERHLCNMML